MTTRAVAAIVLMLSSTTIAACSADHHRATAPATTVEPVSSIPKPSPSQLVRSCPARAPRHVPSHQRAGTDTALVPGHPIGLLACRYHGFNQHASIGTLATTATLPPAEVARELNTTPKTKSSVLFNCPADFGETYDLYFAYAVGHAILVRIEHGGCTSVTNGDLTLLFASAPVVRSLEAALGQDKL